MKLIANKDMYYGGKMLKAEEEFDCEPTWWPSLRECKDSARYGLSQGCGHARAHLRQYVVMVASRAGVVHGGVAAER
jgi:hypothetical protein